MNIELLLSLVAIIAVLARLSDSAVEPDAFP